MLYLGRQSSLNLVRGCPRQPRRIPFTGSRRLLRYHFIPPTHAPRPLSPLNARLLATYTLFLPPTRLLLTNVTLFIPPNVPPLSYALHTLPLFPLQVLFSFFIFSFLSAMTSTSSPHPCLSFTLSSRAILHDRFLLLVSLPAFPHSDIHSLGFVPTLVCH